MLPGTIGKRRGPDKPGLRRRHSASANSLCALPTGLLRFERAQRAAEIEYRAVAVGGGRIGKAGYRDKKGRGSS